MDQPGQHLQTVHQRRTRAAVQPAAVHGENPAGADRREIGPLRTARQGSRLFQRPHHPEPARHHQHDLGGRGDEPPPVQAPGRLPGDGQGIVTTGQRHQFGHPVAGGPQRVAPFQTGDAGAPAGHAHRPDHPGHPLLQTTGNVLGGLGDPGRGADAPHVSERLTQRSGLYGEHPRPAGQPVQGLRHPVRGHRAHLAEALGDDEVGCRGPQRLQVDLIEGGSLPGRLGDGAVDGGAGQPLGEAAAHQHRQGGSTGGLRAVAAHPRQARAEPQVQQRLRGAGHQRDDALRGRGRDGGVGGGHRLSWDVLRLGTGTGPRALPACTRLPPGHRSALRGGALQRRARGGIGVGGRRSRDAHCPQPRRRTARLSCGSPPPGAPEPRPPS
jgi:hypothetical protein